jgi:hypothetical protein
MDTSNPYNPPRDRLALAALENSGRARPDRRRSWSLWFLALTVCSVLLILVGAGFKRDRSIGLNNCPWPDGPIPWHDPSIPWPIRAVYVLTATHLVITAAAFVATFWITSRLKQRILAWLVLVIMLGWTLLCTVDAYLATTGR